ERAGRTRIRKALHHERALILMGTDAPQLVSGPRVSLQRQRALRGPARMPPREGLRSGAAQIARPDGGNDRPRAVAAGRRADLLLLDANPLEDISNIGRISGVMVEGRWLDGEQIAARLEAIAQRAAAQAN